MKTGTKIAIGAGVAVGLYLADPQEEAQAKAKVAQWNNSPAAVKNYGGIADSQMAPIAVEKFSPEEEKYGDLYTGDIIENWWASPWVHNPPVPYGAPLYVIPTGPKYTDGTTQSQLPPAAVMYFVYTPAGMEIHTAV